MLFPSRQAAGMVLAQQLAIAPQATVVAIPRGGLAVAEPIAARMGTDVVVCPVVRSLAPGAGSLGVGAVAGWHEHSLVCDDVVAMLGMEESDIDSSVDLATTKLLELRNGLSEPTFASRIEDAEVILVDDCVATGSTMLAACKMLVSYGARRVLAATPAISAYGCERLNGTADEILYLHRSRAASFSRAVVYPDK